VLSSTQAGEVTRIIAANPGCDEIEVVARVARLASDMVGRLGRRLVATRAARLFAVDNGRFQLDDTPPLGAIPPVDARWILYSGVRAHYTIDRLHREVASMADAITVPADADLAAFGFGEGEADVLARLVGARMNLAPSPADLDAAHRRGDRARAPVRGRRRGRPRRRAGPAAARPRRSPDRARRGRRTDVGPRPTPDAAPRPTTDAADRSGSTPAVTRTVTPTACRPHLRPAPCRRCPAPPPAPCPSCRAPPPARCPPCPRTSTVQPSVPRTTTPLPPRTSTGAMPVVPRPVTGSMPAIAPTPSSPGRSRRLAARRVADPVRAQQLIADRRAALDAGADHFAMLGLTIDAPLEDVRAAYFELARYLHPDRLAAAGITDERRDAHRVFARINEAFGVLSDPDRRAAYQQQLRAGGVAVVAAQTAQADAQVRAAIGGEEAYRKGEMALRRMDFLEAINQFRTAVELGPQEADHHAMLGWALYVAAPSKADVLSTARGHLRKGVELTTKSACRTCCSGGSRGWRATPPPRSTPCARPRSWRRATTRSRPSCAPPRPCGSRRGPAGSSAARSRRATRRRCRRPRRRSRPGRATPRAGSRARSPPSPAG
jgi:DnaJ-domain-containing protein 1